MVRRTPMVFAALFALALPATLSAQGTLEGRVTAAGSTTPLPSVQVSIPSLSLGGSSGPSGMYSVGGIPAGTHEVVFERIGFQEVRRQVTISDGQTTSLDVSLSETTLALGALVVVGTRAQPRTVTESPVPVVVIPSGEIVNQGTTDFAVAMPAAGGQALLVLVLAHTLVLTTVVIAVQILLVSMIADAADVTELATGRRLQGVFFSVLTFIAKASSGIGGFLAGVVLDVIAFPAAGAAVDPAQPRLLAAAMVPVLIVLYALLCVFLAGYRITREEHGRAVAELAARA